MYQELVGAEDLVGEEALKAQVAVLEAASTAQSLDQVKFLAGKAVGLDIARQRIQAYRKKLIQDG